MVNDGTKHHSDSTQLEKLEDDRRQHAALVSQTRVSSTLQNLLNMQYLQPSNLIFMITDLVAIGYKSEWLSIRKPCGFIIFCFNGYYTSRFS